jgi:hypothetical protein
MDATVPFATFVLSRGNPLMTVGKRYGVKDVGARSRKPAIFYPTFFTISASFIVSRSARISCLAFSSRSIGIFQHGIQNCVKQFALLQRLRS